MVERSEDTARRAAGFLVKNLASHFGTRDLLRSYEQELIVYVTPSTLFNRLNDLLIDEAQRDRVAYFANKWIQGSVSMEAEEIRCALGSLRVSEGMRAILNRKDTSMKG